MVLWFNMNRMYVVSRLRKSIGGSEGLVGFLELFLGCLSRRGKLVSCSYMFDYCGPLKLGYMIFNFMKFICFRVLVVTKFGAFYGMYGECDAFGWIDLHTMNLMCFELIRCLKLGFWSYNTIKLLKFAFLHYDDSLGSPIAHWASFKIEFDREGGRLSRWASGAFQL